MKYTMIFSITTIRSEMSIRKDYHCIDLAYFSLQMWVVEFQNLKWVSGSLIFNCYVHELVIYAGRRAKGRSSLCIGYVSFHATHLKYSCYASSTNIELVAFSKWSCHVLACSLDGSLKLTRCTESERRVSRGSFFASGPSCGLPAMFIKNQKCPSLDQILK